MADNNSKKSPPLSAATTGSLGSKTVRKQRSRILGTPSMQDLNGRFVEDQKRGDIKEQSPVENEVPEEPTEPAPAPQQQPIPEVHVESSSKEPTPPPAGPQQEQPAMETASPRKDSAWSFWARKSSLDRRATPSIASESTPQHTSTAASIKSSKSLISDTDDFKKPLEVHSQPVVPPETHERTCTAADQASVKSKESTEKKEQAASWIGWRKPSVTSLKKAAAVEEELSNNNDQVKSVATETSAHHAQTTDAPPPKPKERTWSIFANPTPPQKETLTNIILSGTAEAVLFEPTTHEAPDPVKKHKEPRIPNRVVPDFEKSLPPYTTAASIINNVNRLRYTLGFDVENPKHLYRTQARPTWIKKVLIIGVHGFFPNRMLRPLIGEPTGTSVKFTDEAEKAIWRWAKREKLDISVQKLALTKDGKILERVEYFYEVIKKWKENVDSADYIYFAAHSQGCPVSIILLAKLLEDGIISMQGKKISLLAMAGINNGPFYGTDTKILVRAYSSFESDSMMELFEFQKFDSTQSREFLQSLRTIIAHNVKVTFVGSINDQLVPLYSSTCLHVRHPNIFRSTYVDGSSSTPEFVTRTVGMANHLHNVGLSDHGVINEISNTLGGPLTGGGHSSIYKDPQVYDLAISFSLYTSDLKYQIPLHFMRYDIDKLGTNPFHLPWCMRGLLFEARAHFKDADEDIEQLFEEFESWKPETKQLKDMKYRLNGIKSKL